MPRTSPHRRILATGSGPSFGDDQIFARLHTVGIQAALSILLSVFGLGSAMAQSIDQDMALSANTQATRDRVISELRQARTDGTFWTCSAMGLRRRGSLRRSSRPLAGLR